MQAQPDKKKGNWYLDVLIHSEKELDNLQEISSVTSANSCKMSWPGEGSHNHGFEPDGKNNDRSEQVYPLRPGTGAPPHRLKGSEKKRSSVKFDIDVSEGKTAKKLETQQEGVESMPDQQTDVPVFSVSSSKKKPIRYDSSMSFESSFSAQPSEGDSRQEDFPRKLKRRSSKERKKRRQSSKSNFSEREDIQRISIKDRATSSEDCFSSPQKITRGKVYPGDSSDLSTAPKQSFSSFQDSVEKNDVVTSEVSSPVHGSNHETKDKNPAVNLDELEQKRAAFGRNKSQPQAFWKSKGKKVFQMNQVCIIITFNIYIALFTLMISYHTI